MKTKKILSIFLAMLMMLSLSAVAFAADGYNWVKVPTSPEGLSAGDYYLDFTFDYYDWSPDVRDDRLAMWNAGEWYVDHNAHAVKGSFTVPAAISDTGEAFTQVIDPSTDLYVFAVVSVGQWQPIPTSPAGLENGEFYLDFTYDWDAWSPASRQARLDMWNAGEWYVDHTNRMIKGTFTVPAEQSESGASFVRVVRPHTSESTDLYVKALMRVGNWVKIPTSPDGLSAGDFYMDVPALAAAIGTTEADLEGAEYYGDAISGDIYLVYEGYSRMYFGHDTIIINCMKEIPQSETPTDPDQQDPDDQEENRPQGSGLWKKIVSFFLRLVDFFKKIFGVG